MGVLLDSLFKDGRLALTVKTDRLDAASAREFRAECDAAWPDAVEQLSVDLSRVEFVDSSGIAALLSLYRRLSPDQPNVSLTGVKPRVQTVIELLRLHRIFKIAP
jgi:anti-anti-sigma factor